MNVGKYCEGPTHDIFQQNLDPGWKLGLGGKACEKKHVDTSQERINEEGRKQFHQNPGPIQISAPLILEKKRGKFKRHVTSYN